MTMTLRLAALSLSALLALRAQAHISIWHPSMWGFNVTQQDYSYDNRPVTPLMNYTFSQWWFHGHLDHPPNPGDFFELPAGQAATAELACNKGATTWWNSSEGHTFLHDPNNPTSPCPGQDMSEYHTTGEDDLFGCALAITYESDVTQVKPEDFTVFSVNHTCVWTVNTTFPVPAAMPPCPEGGCICAWFWIHSPDSGGEQNYMNGFRCNVTGSTSNVALAPPQIPRRCGADPANGKMQASPGNCTYGAKQPFYWFQAENNNMFEGTYAPPRYLDMYNFPDGAQNDIFQNSYPSGLPPPSPNSTVVPTPVPFNAAAAPATSATLISTSVSSTPSPSTTSDATSIFSTASASSSSFVSSPSAPAPISTVVVVTTATVTQTFESPSVPTSSSASVSTSTVVNVVFVTVTADNATPAASTSVPEASVGSEASFASGSETAISPSATVASSANSTTTSEFFQLDAVDATSESQSSSPVVQDGTGGKVCKRGDDFLTTARASRPKSLLSLPGLNSHRKMKKRSSLWNIF